MASDNFGEHASQTMVNNIKYAACLTDINSTNLETRATETQVYPFEIDEEIEKEQMTPLQLLNLEMKSIIEKEFEERLRDPTGLLPTDLESIKINKDVQVFNAREKDAPQTRNIGATRMGDTVNSHTKDERTRPAVKKYGAETGTMKVGDGYHGQTENTMTTKNKTAQNNALIQEKIQNFQISLENENKHLILTENENKLFKSEELLQNAMYSIRILNQAKYHKEYVQYRNYPEIIKNEKAGLYNSSGYGQQKKTQEARSDDKGSSKYLQNLFTFYNQNHFEERTVSSMDWNPVNNDLLAATYGEFELAPRFKKESLNSGNLEGALAFWTLKSPEFPERVIKTSSRATSCKFSPRNPNLIGVGLYDGVIAIYDIRKKGNQPIADSKELDLKHLDVVWDVNWIQRSNTTDKGEGLVSISSDGKIIEWSIKKGLESQELKVLNRVTNPHIKNDKADTINFRYTTGFR